MAKKADANEIAAAEFKAKCLSLIDEVSTKGRQFIVTKRGKPVARLVPIDWQDTWKSLKHSVLYEAPDAFDHDEEWEMEKD